MQKELVGLGLNLAQAATNSKVQEAVSEIVSNPKTWQSFSPSKKWEVVGYVALGAVCLLGAYFCADKIIQMYKP